MHRAALPLLVFAGCSADIDCAFLADPSNCFAKTAAALETCMPMRATPAKLSVDQMTCTFADGVYVVFSAPVPELQGWENRGFNFTVFGPDDSSCGDVAYFSNAGDGLRVRHGSQSAFWTTPIDDQGYELSCGSETYTGSSDDSFGSCGPAAVVPRFTYSRTGPPYTFTLSSAASESPLFVCE